MSDSLWPHGLCSPWNSPGQNTGMGSLPLLQGIFPTQGLNPGLPNFRWILYQLSHTAPSWMVPADFSMLSSANVQTSSQFSSVAQSCPTLRPRGLQHARPPCPSPTPGDYSNSCPLSRWWCHATISSLYRPLLPHSVFPSIRFFSSKFFASGGQSIGASALVLPMNIQDWFPLGWTGWISLQSKGLSRVFSNTTVQKHQFFEAQLSSWSNYHIHTWLLEEP